jgi:hypothetical protein
VRLEVLGKLKKSNELLRNRTGELPACSIVPQPTTLPDAPIQVTSTLICLREPLQTPDHTAQNDVRSVKLLLVLASNVILDFRSRRDL